MGETAPAPNRTIPLYPSGSYASGVTLSTLPPNAHTPVIGSVHVRRGWLVLAPRLESDDRLKATVNCGCGGAVAWIVGKLLDERERALAADGGPPMAQGVWTFLVLESNGRHLRKTAEEPKVGRQVRAYFFRCNRRRRHGAREYRRSGEAVARALLRASERGRDIVLGLDL